MKKTIPVYYTHLVLNDIKYSFSHLPTIFLSDVYRLCLLDVKEFVFMSEYINRFQKLSEQMLVKLFFREKETENKV